MPPFIPKVQHICCYVGFFSSNRARSWRDDDRRMDANVNFPSRTEGRHIPHARQPGRTFPKEGTRSGGATQGQVVAKSTSPRIPRTQIVYVAGIAAKPTILRKEVVILRKLSSSF